MVCRRCPTASVRQGVRGQLKLVARSAIIASLYHEIHCKIAPLRCFLRLTPRIPNRPDPLVDLPARAPEEIPPRGDLVVRLAVAHLPAHRHFFAALFRALSMSKSRTRFEASGHMAISCVLKQRQRPL